MEIVSKNVGYEKVFWKTRFEIPKTWNVLQHALLPLWFGWKRLIVVKFQSFKNKPLFDAVYDVLSFQFLFQIEFILQTILAWKLFYFRMEINLHWKVSNDDEDKIFQDFELNFLYQPNNFLFISCSKLKCQKEKVISEFLRSLETFMFFYKIVFLL